MTTSSTDRAGREASANWERLALWWDERKEGTEGSRVHRELVAPAAQELLAVQPGERILDIACGNGQFSRRLAGLGAQVVAFDFSSTLIERARSHSSEHDIDYHVADATDEGQLRALSEEPFDAAVGNMALMSIADVTPLFGALARMLRPGGRAVFTVLHPCFPYPSAPGGTAPTDADVDRPRLRRRLVRQAKAVLPAGARVRVVRGLHAFAAARHGDRYLVEAPHVTVAAHDQPLPLWVFHRPLQALLRPAFAVGFVLDGLTEPAWTHAPGQAVLVAARLRLPPVAS